MKLLKDILYKAGLEEVHGSTNIAVENIEFDSRLVKNFTVFVAMRGTQTDGHQFIDKAISLGAVAIVCEQLPIALNPKITYVLVKDASVALAYIADNFYDHPSTKLSLIGITGTNGKTTTVTLLYNLFKQLGYKCGMLSTVRNYIGNEIVEATHTTPDSLALNRMLAQMVERGCAYCFMEVSSHAVEQNRILGLEFKIGVFTNISHDHLDYHKTFDNYILAKKRFFDLLPEGSFALVNADDQQGITMAQDTKAHVRTFGLKSMADFKAKIIENQITGLHLHISDSELYSKLIGGFNAYNILTVYAVAMLLEEEKLDVLTTISALEFVEGRFQIVKSEGNITAIVDYAHTPDALQNVLSTISSMRNGNEKVITVIGCGGNRDAEKRPIMASIACEFSNQVILTSDNPRNEDPNLIIADMQKGIDPVGQRKSVAVADRREAIKMACTLANAGDILLIAGKGHEKYQEVNGVRTPFDDIEVVNEMLQLLKK